MKGVIAVGNNDTQVTEPGSVTEVSSDNSQESATLVAGDANDGDKFGYSVALSSDGSRALVGAFRDDDPYGTESGAAYLFQRTADGWRQETKLVAPSGNVEEWFGWDVTLNADGTTALVSAFLADPNGDGSGAVQVFTRTSGNWQHQSRLTGNDTTEGDRFGSGVALADAGDTALVGAWRASDKSGTGATYVFDNNGATWTQTARIKPDSQNAGAAFG
jgi:hypothetical protein